MRDQAPTSYAALRESKKAERRARSELEADERRREIELEIAGSRIAGRINALEREAQAHLRERLPRSFPFDVAWDRVYLSPSPRTMKGAYGAEPIERTSRPLSVDGAQSFHFAVVAVSRGDELRQALAAPHKVRKPNSLGASHQRYLEREEAAERLPSQPSRMQTYIEGAEKVESIDMPVDERGGLIVSSFGNLPGDAVERAKFWAMAAECERAPHHKIYLDPSIESLVFERVRGSPAVASLMDKTRAALARDEPSVLEDVSTEEALRLVDLFFRAGQADRFEVSDKKKPGASVGGAPLKIMAGRGGVHQIRLVVELPAELSPGQRYDLAKAFCRPFAENELPHWAVVHAPTSSNDDRNYHLHVNLYDRPSKHVTLPDGRRVPDFAYEEDQYDAKRRRTRRHRPLRQNKVGAIAHRDWPRRERIRFTKLANEAMAAAGIAKRLDPRTYKDMGIDQPARIAISKSDYAREAKGEQTSRGREVAADQWQWRLFTLACEDRARRRALLDQFEAPPAGVEQYPSEAIAIVDIAKWHAMQVGRGRIADEETDRDLAVFMAERLSSRARLKKPVDRDPIDREGLALAEEFQRQADEHSATLARLKREAAELEAELDFAVARERVATQAVKDHTAPYASAEMNTPENAAALTNRNASARGLGSVTSPAEVATIPMLAQTIGGEATRADDLGNRANRNPNAPSTRSLGSPDRTQQPTAVLPIVHGGKQAGTRAELSPNLADAASDVQTVQRAAAKPAPLQTAPGSSLKQPTNVPAAPEQLVRNAVLTRPKAERSGKAMAKLARTPIGLPMLSNAASIVWRTDVINQVRQKGNGRLR